MTSTIPLKVIGMLMLVMLTTVVPTLFLITVPAIVHTWRGMVAQFRRERALREDLRKRLELEHLAKIGRMLG